jgi:hypothetical protein
MGEKNAWASSTRVPFATLNTLTSTVALDWGMPKSRHEAYVPPTRKSKERVEKRRMLAMF